MAYPFRTAVDELAIRAPGGRAVHYPLTWGTQELTKRKAVGEADSFPYRLIKDLFYFRYPPKDEAPVLAAAAVSEFDAVPE
jgi:hypothetical protein